MLAAGSAASRADTYCAACALTLHSLTLWRHGHAVMLAARQRRLEILGSACLGLPPVHPSLEGLIVIKRGVRGAAQSYRPLSKDAIAQHLEDFGMEAEITHHNAILGLSGAHPRLAARVSSSANVPVMGSACTPYTLTISSGGFWHGSRDRQPQCHPGPVRCGPETASQGPGPAQLIKTPNLKNPHP